MDTYAFRSSLIIVLVLRALCFAGEVLFTHTTILEQAIQSKRKQKLAKRLVLWLPVLLWTLCCVMSTVALRENTLTSCSAGTRLELNPDIGGQGVRASVYISQGITILVLTAGHFHTGSEGMNEIGIMQGIALLCVVLNLFKGVKELNFQELALGSLLADGTSTAIAMTLSGKQTLAARSLVMSLSFLQGMVLVGIALAMSWITYLDATTTCTPTLYWWGVIRPGQRLPSTFYLYYTLRIIIYVHCSWLSITAAPLFDILEKSERGILPPRSTLMGQLPTRLPNAAGNQTGSSTQLGSHEAGHVRAVSGQVIENCYTLLPATVFSNYLEYIPIAISCIVTVEVFLKKTGLSSSGDILEVAQFSSLITCLATAGHALYTYSKVFTKNAAREGNRLEEDDAATPPASTVDLEQISTSTSWMLSSILRLRSRLPLHLLIEPEQAIDYIRLHHARWNEKPWWQVSPEMFKAEQQRLDTNLIQAISLGVGHPKTLQIALHDGANPNAIHLRKENTLPVLLFAVALGNDKAVSQLLDAGADIDALDGKGNGVLATALISDHKRTFDLLQNRKAGKRADPNGPDSDYGTVLARASSTGDGATAILLLKAGADINLHRNGKGTALQVALSENKEDMVQLLLKNGADVNISSPEMGTPLQIACFEGKLATVRTLLNRRADINAPEGKFHTALQAAYLAIISKGGSAPRDIFDLLLERGANDTTGSKMSPSKNYLHEASRLGSIDTVRTLLDNGANVNLQIGKYHTALQAACFGRNVDVVVLLLERGALVNLQGGYFNTALQAACQKGRGGLDIVKLLIENGAEVNLLGGCWDAALGLASHSGAIDIVRFLLHEGAAIDANGANYGTALQKACMGGHEDVIKLLLKRGADVNLRGGKYDTPLQAACGGCTRYGWGSNTEEFARVVQGLLDHGAEVNFKGGFFGTAIQAALQNGQNGEEGIADLLRARGADEPDEYGWKRINHARHEAELDMCRNIYKPGPEPTYWDTYFEDDDVAN